MVSGQGVFAARPTTDSPRGNSGPQSAAGGVNGGGTVNTPGAGIFVFEADTAAFANRKRAARACASCQKRKKRCPHTFSKEGEGSSSTTGGFTAGGITGNGGLNDGAEKILPNLTHKEPIRFVGDLNPESILTDLSTRRKSFRRTGTWVEQSELRSHLDRHEEDAASGDGATSGNGSGTTVEISGTRHRPNDIRQAAVEKYSKIERGRRTLTGHQKNYLQAVGAFRVLPKATEDALVTTYIACIDPILPIIDGPDFLQQYTSGEASVFLVQAICLVACKTEEAVPWLRLYEDGPLLDPIPFARSLHTGLDAAMKADLEADRFTKVQIMTLMSLHNDGPGGVEESSVHLVQAIHDAQTTGMHINTPGRTRNDQGAQLWWTLWMLDKFNACLGGRPLMIAERDIDIEEPTLEDNSRSQALAVWLRLGGLLDRVIEYYRPIADPDATGWEQGFPSWEELTVDCEFDWLHTSHKSLLELCYNIIGILACRSGGPTTISYKRRITCADRIQSILSQTYSEPMPPIPLLPYATSLSLTVVYRGLRDHHTNTHIALSDLSTRCEMLEKLSKTWWTADAMAKLGRKALKSLQQALQHQQQGRSDIADTLEAEVSVCKYSPWLGEKGATDDSSSANATISSNNRRVGQTAMSGLDNLNGTALHLLSDAAATHGRPKSSLRGKRPSASETNNDADLHAKRRRMDRSKHSLAASQHHRNNSTGSSPLTIMNSASHTETTTPSSYHEQHLDESLHAQSLNTPATSILPDTTRLPDPVQPDMDSFPNFADYNDLDTLFDGFFDLAMPTIFQDPLFDGQAYFNGPGAEDYDFNFMGATPTSTGGAGGGSRSGPGAAGPGMSTNMQHDMAFAMGAPANGQGLMDPRMSMNVNVNMNVLGMNGPGNNGGNGEFARFQDQRQINGLGGR